MTLTRLKNTEVIKAFSPTRLSPYRNNNSSDAETLAAYKKNVQLSMALYPILQQFEIVFRNQLEQILITDHGTHWYTASSFINTLDSWAKNELQKTVSKLTKNNNTTHSGAVVSESTFGFWTALLGIHYNQTIWFLHSKTLFPYTPIRDIKKIRTDLKSIRNLRNHIAHHEPIWHDKDLFVKYQTIIQLLGWMNPHVTLWLQRTKLDHFVVVHKSVYHPTPRKPRVKK
jgi:abortive infection bacteriophage resistance protein